MYCLFVCLFTDVDGALSKALLVGNFEAAVDICIGDGRMVSKTLLLPFISCTYVYMYCWVPPPPVFWVCGLWP